MQNVFWSGKLPTIIFSESFLKRNHFLAKKMTDKETNCLITGGAVPAPDVQILKANINFSKNKPTTVVPKHS